MIDAVVLAGGRARRLDGADKSALVFEGSTLLDRALAAVEGTAQRVVVGEAPTSRLPAGVRVVREHPPFSGPASAVMAGVDALDAAGTTATWVYVIACDVVRAAEVTGALEETMRLHPDADGVVPLDEEGRRQSLVGLYRLSALRAARAAIGEVAGRSMTSLLAPLRLIEIAVDSWKIADVDTPDQAAALGIAVPRATTTVVPRATPARNPSVEEARRLAHELGCARPTALRSMSLDSASGFTLARDVVAHTAVPAFANAAMDGWAVAGPGAGPLRGPWWIGPPIHAGDRPSESAFSAGEARPIMTGAPVPAGAWGVVRAEDGVVVHDPQEGGDLLTLARGTGDVREGHHIRPAAEEVGEGEPVLHRGELLTPPRLGLAAACGLDEVTVREAPTVALIVVGDEVIGSGASGGGRVRDALSPQLVPFVTAVGGRALGVVRAGDDVHDIATAIVGSVADVTIITGGTSAGDADHTRSALMESGANVSIDGVSMRPGRPAIVAVRGRAVIVCLPGNPLAAMVAALVLVTPLVAGMLGRPLEPLPMVRLAEDVPNDRPGSLLVPHRASAGSVVSTGWAGSGMLRGLAMADGVTVVQPGGARRDQLVSALPLPWH